MSVDLDRQLREYCRDMDEKQGALAFEDILERTGELQVLRWRGNQQLPSRRRWIAAAAAALAVIVVAVGIRLLPSASPEPAVQPTTTPTQPATTSASTQPTTTPTQPATTASTLRALPLPDTSPNEPAGEYGWVGTPGDRGWMHHVIEDPPGVTRQTQLAFAVDDDCFAGAPGAEPTAVTVAGLDGVYLEPYDDDSVYWSTSHPSGGETTGAYALPVGDRTLCVYLRWDLATTPEELSAAREVVESIRSEPVGEDGIRINFTLPEDWDTG